MDRLKSIFVSTYTVLILVCFSLSIYQTVLNEFDVKWLGIGIIYGVGLIYFIRIFLTHTPRVSKKMPLSFILVFIGFSILIYGNITENIDPRSLSIGISGVISWLLYAYWATDFPRREEAEFEIGKKLPNSILNDINGNETELDSFLGNPSVFLFYRGNWCPFCMAQIKELSKEYRLIKEQGANLIFVSPQSEKHTKSLSRKFDIPAVFLIDKDLKAAKKLGIFGKANTPLGMEVLGFETDNVMPTLIITNKDGIIKYADLTDNYRVRPEPQTYLSLLGKI